MSVKFSLRVDRLIGNIGLLPGLLETRTRNRLEAIASMAEQRARSGAPWKDRTGEARKQLRVVVDEVAGSYTMYFIQGVEYGIFLETSNGGRFQILVPTMQLTAAEILRQIRGIL